MAPYLDPHQVKPSTYCSYPKIRSYFRSVLNTASVLSRTNRHKSSFLKKSYSKLSRNLGLWLSFTRIRAEIKTKRKNLFTVTVIPPDPLPFMWKSHPSNRREHPRTLKIFTTKIDRNRTKTLLTPYQL